jgi:hypothetical protein
MSLFTYLLLIAVVAISYVLGRWSRDDEVNDRHRLIEMLGGVIEYQTETIEELRDALRPFAAMHREGTDLDEMACSRGVASDMTCVYSVDFKRAHEVLDEFDSGGDEKEGE